MSASLLRISRNLFDAQATAVGGLLRRIDGSHEIDPWGFDAEAHSALMSLAAARWSVDVDGLGHVPELGPVVLVVRQGLGFSEQLVVSLALCAVGRHVRRVGIPRSEILEPSFRLTGNVMNDPAEIRGLLRDDHAVSIPMGRVVLGNRPGTLDPLVIGPAVDLGVPVLPVAVSGGEWRRRRRVVIGPPIDAPAEDGRLGAIEMAGRVRDAVAHIDSTRLGRR